MGCSGDDTPKEEPNNIPQELIGKWKIVQVYETDGGSEPQWRDENTGHSYDYWFKSNGAFLQSDGVISGSYVIDENNDIELTVNSVKKYHIEYLSSNTLIIDLLNFEPLKLKFIKVSQKNLMTRSFQKGNIKDILLMK